MKQTALLSTAVVTALLASALTACATTSNTTTITKTTDNSYPVASVFKQMAINGIDETLVSDMGCSMGVENMEMTMALATAGIDINNPKLVTYHGKQLIETNSAAFFMMNDYPFDVIQAKDYFFPNSYVYAGSYMNEDSYSVVTRQYDVPTMATIGSSGKLSEGYDIDSNSTGKTPTSSTWHLEAASNSNAELCIKEDYADGSEGSTCHTINKQGEILDTVFSGTFVMEEGMPAVNFVSK